MFWSILSVAWVVPWIYGGRILGKGTKSAAGMISADLGVIVGYFDSHVYF